MNQIRKMDAAMGLVFLVLLGAALLSPGMPPKSDDSIAHLTSIVTGSRPQLIYAMLLAGLASMAFLWFVGAVRIFVQPGENSLPGTVLVAASVLAMAFMLGGMAILTGFALNAQSHTDITAMRAFTDTSNVIIGMTKFPFALFVIATCVAAMRTSRLAGWIIVAGFAAAVLAIASTVSFLFTTGVLEFGGPVDLGGASLPALWTAILSIAMLRSIKPVP